MYNTIEKKADVNVQSPKFQFLSSWKAIKNKNRTGFLLQKFNYIKTSASKGRELWYIPQWRSICEQRQPPLFSWIFEINRFIITKTCAFSDMIQSRLAQLAWVSVLGGAPLKDGQDHTWLIIKHTLHHNIRLRYIDIRKERTYPSHY